MNNNEIEFIPNGYFPSEVKQTDKDIEINKLYNELSDEQRAQLNEYNNTKHIPGDNSRIVKVMCGEKEYHITETDYYQNKVNGRIHPVVFNDELHFLTDDQMLQAIELEEKLRNDMKGKMEIDKPDKPKHRKKRKKYNNKK